MENTCRDIQKLMPGLIEGTLTREQTAELQDHISQCRACSQHLKALQRDDRLLTAFAKTMRSTIAGIEDSVIPALAGEVLREPIGSASIWRTLRKRPVAKFAVAASLIFVFLLLSVVKLTENRDLEMETSPRCILAEAQNDHLKETRPWDILPPLPK
ncbi:MAG: anti-sigma factor family protein [Planctomycetota bacterium]|jgi:anti-sigma factor RsiW